HSPIHRAHTHPHAGTGVADRRGDHTRGRRGRPCHRTSRRSGSVRGAGRHRRATADRVGGPAPQPRRDGAGMSTTTDPQETNAPEQQGTDPPGGPSRARTTRRRRLRLVTVLVVLAAVTGVGYLLLLTIGPVALSPGQVLAALTGGGNARTINL